MGQAAGGQEFGLRPIGAVFGLRPIGVVFGLRCVNIVLRAPQGPKTAWALRWARVWAGSAA